MEDVPGVVCSVRIVFSRAIQALMNELAVDGTSGGQSTY